MPDRFEGHTGWKQKYNIHKRPDKPYIRTLTVVNTPKGIGIVTNRFRAYGAHAKRNEDGSPKDEVWVAVATNDRASAITYYFYLDDVDLVDMDVDHISKCWNFAVCQVLRYAFKENIDYEWERARVEVPLYFEGNFDLPNTEIKFSRGPLGYEVDLKSTKGLFDKEFIISNPLGGDSDLIAEIIQLAYGWHKEPRFTTKRSKPGKCEICTRKIDWDDINGHPIDIPVKEGTAYARN